jgi:hypothetical protein
MSKVGRPKKKGERRNRQLVVMVTESELRAMRAWALKQPHSLSTIARDLLLKEMSSSGQ